MISGDIPDILILGPTGPGSATVPFTHIATFGRGVDNADFANEYNWGQVDYHGLGAVHRGFAAAADSVYARIADSVGLGVSQMPLPLMPVAVVGHGVGAVIAALFGARLAASRGGKVTAYLSGMPRVGDEKWNASFNRNLAWWLTVNRADDVTNLPLPTMVPIGADRGVGHTTPAPANIYSFECQTGTPAINSGGMAYANTLSGGAVSPPAPAMWKSPFVAGL